MTQKVATERKMKLRQETTSLDQIATVMAKLRISDNEQWFGLFISSLNAERELLSSIFLALQRTSLLSDLQWTLLSARRSTLHLRNPAQLLGELGTRLSFT